jgi:hypothetical protein
MTIVKANYVVKPVSNFHSSGYLSEKTIAEARRSAPDSISRVLTYLQGDYSKKIPLTMLSEGQFKNTGAIQKVGIDSVEYQWDVIGDLDKADAICASNYGATDKPGIGSSEITVSFKTNWLKYQHIITNYKGTRLRVNGRPTKGATGWVYKLILMTNNPLDYVDPAEFAMESKWIMAGPGIVSAELSRGNESNVATGGKMKGQLSAMRKSFHYAGHVDQVVECHLENDKGQKQMYWMSWAEWQHEIQWKVLTENQAWEGIYNRTNDGRILQKDPETGMELLSGAGVKQQIPNWDTYTTLTANKIDRTFLNVMYQNGIQADSGKLHVLFCGRGFRRDFHDAIMAKAGTQFILDGNQFISEYDGGLMFGKYFGAYKTNEGDIIKLEDLPLLDYGPEAKIAPKHPVTGFPMTSHSAFLLDMSTYEGESNVKMVHQNGRLMIKGKEQGMTLLGNDNRNDGDYLALSTDQDRTSIHYLSVKNPAIRNAQKCFYLACDASIGI